MYSRPSASTIRLPRPRTNAIAGSTLRLSETTPPAITASPRRSSDCDASLPIPDAAIGIESPLQKFLLERMLADLGLVDLDAEPGPGGRPHGAGLRIHLESFLDHVGTPRDVGVDRLADHVRRRGEPEL